MSTTTPDADRAPSPLLDREGAVGRPAPDAGVAWHHGDPLARAAAAPAGGAVVDRPTAACVTVAGPTG